MLSDLAIWAVGVLMGVVAGGFMMAYMIIHKVDDFLSRGGMMGGMPDPEEMAQDMMDDMMAVSGENSLDSEEDDSS